MTQATWKSAVFLLLVAITATPLRGQQTVQLGNGDRLTGTLARIEGTTWVFRHGAGELKIPAANIQSFTSPTRIGLRLTDGTVLAARVTPAGDQLQLVRPDGSSRVAAPAEIAAVGNPERLEMLRPIAIGYFTPIHRFWGATASLGFADKSGNSRSRGITADVELRRRSPRDRITLRLGVAREESRPPNVAPSVDSLETTVEKYYGSLRIDVFFGPRLFAFAATAQERDQFQDIDLRSAYNAGLGLQLLSTDATDLRVNVSGGLRREAFTSGATSETNAIIGVGTALRQALGPAVFDWSLDWGPTVDDFSDYRFISEASISTRVFGGLGFRIASRNEVNNRPQPGVEKHDMLLTSTLTYSIGR